MKKKEDSYSVISSVALLSQPYLIIICVTSFFCGRWIVEWYFPFILVFELTLLLVAVPQLLPTIPRLSEKEAEQSRVRNRIVASERENGNI